MKKFRIFSANYCPYCKQVIMLLTYKGAHYEVFDVTNNDVEEKMMLQILTEGNFKNTVSKGITVVDFYADWCGPCKMLNPILERLSEKVEAKICKVNVDESRELAQQFGVKGIPFLVVMKDGKMVEESVGLKDEAMLLEMIGRHANTRV